jgi:hypothetical protein
LAESTAITVSALLDDTPQVIVTANIGCLEHLRGAERLELRDDAQNCRSSRDREPERLGDQIARLFAAGKRDIGVVVVRRKHVAEAQIPRDRADAGVVVLRAGVLQGTWHAGSTISQEIPLGDTA